MTILPKDYKNTLNLPKTDFPMKANLSQREPTIIQFWEDSRIYEKIQAKNRKNKHYILHDGPPYANGPIHIGHALNKILKDIIVKYKCMKGFYSPYVPGWDCHGLPIELQVDKNLGRKKEGIGVLEKRKFCREYAAQFVDIQRNEFKRLGVLGGWASPYLTMSYDYEASTVKEFIQFVEGGYVYKGKKPVHWCPSCVTALAEAEVEYVDKESPSIYVKFRVNRKDVKDRIPAFADQNVFMLIWTTTPWTLPANLALAVHPNFNYVAVASGEEVYIVAEGLLDNLRERLLLKGAVLLVVQGTGLEGLGTEHPFVERQSKVILGDFVNIDEGTGIVHIAPGHGEDDYEIGSQYGLDIFAPVDDRGRFTKQAGELEGLFVFDANLKIIEILKNNDALIKEEKYFHSYPHCWRCKKPIVFRATEQWFISIGHKGLRDICLQEIDRVRWIPSWGKDRIHGMMLKRPDWCISRQRAWGVPIALIKCDTCGGFVKDREVFGKIVKSFEESGADIWFIKEADELLPLGYVCKECGSKSFSKEKDILDVWFDSGISHAAVLEVDKRLSWPADMYLEGSDQHRGWFQSSLIAAVGNKGRSPYKTVLTHGFVVDGQGKKMSKSLGNVVAPQEVIKANGAEILRLWVSAEDYREDVRISREILDRLTEAYRKIRNTCRFLLGNLYDFNPETSSEVLSSGLVLNKVQENHALLEIDKWAMSRLQTLVEKVTIAYEKFNFYEVFHAIYNFCVVDMSSFYLDVLKDRLYTFKADSPERRAAQWVFYQILTTLTRLMAPILSFIAEEVWQGLRQRVQGTGKRAESIKQKTQEIEESVFLTLFPEVDEKYLNRELEEKWEKLFLLRDEVNKALEMKRAEKFIGNSLEAKVVIYIAEGKEQRTLLTEYRDSLPTFFIVSDAEIADKSLDGSHKSSLIEGLEIKVERASGIKCQRCWNWSEMVGKIKEAPEICERCYKVIFK